MSLCDFENESVIILFPGTSWITFAVTGSPSMGEERHLHNNHRVVDFPSLFDLVRLSNTWALSQENDIFWFLGGTFNSLALVQTYNSDVIIQDTSPANGRRNQSCEVCSVGEAWKIPRAAGLLSEDPERSSSRLRADAGGRAVLGVPPSLLAKDPDSGLARICNTYLYYLYRRFTSYESRK